jgi:hypothetical protein
MRTISERLTYANVISTLALFLVLAGGAAYAAKVGKKSVGSSQLKANAVTTAKIKANAITTRKIKRNSIATGKIKNGAVESLKIADGAVTGADINSATTPFGRIVYEARGRSTVDVGEEPVAYPLDNPGYTQEAGSDNLFMGAVDFTFKPACTTPREANAYALVDATDPTDPDTGDIVAAGQLNDANGTRASDQIQMGPAVGGQLQPPTATNHRISIVISMHCNTGEGGTATSGAVDVIGVKK